VSTIQTAGNYLITAENVISNLNVGLVNGVYQSGVMTFSSNGGNVRVFGSQGIFGEVYATRIEYLVTNPSPNYLQKVVFTGRMTIPQGYFQLGNGDSISNITITYAANDSGVQNSYSLDTNLQFDSKGVLNGTLDAYTKTTTETVGVLSGYAYASKYSFTGVDVAGATFDKLTYWTNEKIFLNTSGVMTIPGRLFTLGQSLPRSGLRSRLIRVFL
jgi:hypothetical protein